MENDMPAAPNIMSCRRPNFSMVKTAIHEARKYSRYETLKLVNAFPHIHEAESKIYWWHANYSPVPMAAAKIREMKGLSLS